MRQTVSCPSQIPPNRGEVLVVGLQTVGPGRKVPRDDVPDAADLVVAGHIVSPIVPGIVEAEGGHLLEVVGVEALEVGHLRAELLADRGLEARLQDHVLLGLLDHLEILDVRIHVGVQADPVEVVVAIDVRVRGEAELVPPAVQEGRPVEIGERDPVAFAMAQGLAEAIELGEALLGAMHGHVFRPLRLMPAGLPLGDQRMASQNSILLRPREWSMNFVSFSGNAGFP